MTGSYRTWTWIAGGLALLVALPVAARSPAAPASPEPSQAVMVIGPDGTGAAPAPAIGAPWQRTLDVPDGSLMIDVVTCGDGFTGLAYLPDGDDRPEATVWRSEDGTDWTAVDQPFPGLGRDRSWGVEVLVGFDGGLVAVGSHGPRLVLWHSVDCGRTWRPVADRRAFALPEGDGLDRIEAVATDERLVVVGSVGGEGTPGRWWSWTLESGGAWRQFPIEDGAVAPRYGLGAGRDAFFGVDIVGGDARTGSMLVTSPDGVAWTAVGPLPGIGLPTWDPTGARYLLATNEGGDDLARPTLWASSDGRAWATLAIGSPGSPDWGTDVRAAPGILLWVTDTRDETSGETWSWSARSDDGGATWSVSAGWPGMDFTGATSVAIGPDAVVIAGGDAADTTQAWVQRR